MKKRFLLLTTMLSIALVGCGSNKDINATIETSVPMETVTTEPTTEATVESATESTVESTEQEKINEYEVPVDETTTDENEKVDLSEINDTDTQVADGEENETDSTSNNSGESTSNSESTSNNESTSNSESNNNSNSESNSNSDAPAEETPVYISSESSGTQSFTLNETDIELLKYFGATDSEIANIHSSQELDSLLTRLLEDFENNITSSSGSDSSSSNNDSGNTGSSGGGEDDYDPSRQNHLNPDDLYDLPAGSM